MLAARGSTITGYMGWRFYLHQLRVIYLQVAQEVFYMAAPLVLAHKSFVALNSRQGNQLSVI